jgi:phospholipid-binding lipoprotein MlaA
MTSGSQMNRAKVALLSLFLMLFIASSTVIADDTVTDPWEGFNRSVFEFNETLDMYVAKPIAQVYQTVTPQFLDTGVTNFFSNLEDVLIVANDVFQLKPIQALSDTGRFLINSTIGVFGFFDVASHMGLMKHNEDLGQTLGYWGASSGPYVMLPFLGPSNVRDTFGFMGDSLLGVGPTDIVDTATKKAGLLMFRIVDLRADLIASEGLITGERYTFFRSFYLQRRAYLVADGIIEDEFSDDFDEDFDDSFYDKDGDVSEDF